MPTPYHNFRTQRGWHFPEDVLALLDPILDLGGTYGDPEAGDPIQSDELRIEHDQDAVEIVVYNRAILLFTTDSEAVTTGAVATVARPGNVVRATATT